MSHQPPQGPAGGSGGPRRGSPFGSGQAKPRQRNNNRKFKAWKVLVPLIAVFIVVILSLRGVASIYTDYLWFDSLDYGSIWSKVLLSKFSLSLIFMGVFFVLCWASLTTADRVAPKQRPPGPEEDVLDKYHQSPLGKRAWTVRIYVSVFLALILGVGAYSQWQTWILFINKVNFGIKDPLHNLDIGFYVFQLPFLTYLTNWMFNAFVVVIIFTALAHYVNGGIRFQTKGPRVTPAVKVHLSVLLGILALIKGVDYWLGRYELTTSTQGVVDGASYTDINARLPVLNLLIVIAVVSFGLFIYNIWRKGWVLPVIAVGLWAFVSIVMGSIYPFFVQRFQVDPAESTKEAEYIGRNIEYTRLAMGLDDVRVETMQVNNDVSSETFLRGNQKSIDAIPILDPNILGRTYTNKQGERTFYEFDDILDVDRYLIDGEPTSVVLGTRNLYPQGAPIQSWESQRLVYTHGYGVALAPANTIRSGFPDFRIADLAVNNSLENVPLEEPRIYFSEGLDGYVIVNSSRAEVDGEDEVEGSYSYTGEGGVDVDSFFKKAAFALRFADINPLISNLVGDGSQILYIRDIRERVETLAPFLKYDSNIYPVITDGRVKFLVDAYTTSNRYPYSQRADTEQLGFESGLREDFNYVSNSVKVVVDAFDGTVDFYIVEDDPIIKAWEKAFPSLFKDISEMPDDLKEHIRYPEDLFRVQTNVWARYHLQDSEEFYEQAKGWAVAQDPGGVFSAATTIITASDGTQVASRRQIRIEPYYTLLQLPDSDELEFMTLRPFVPVSGEDNRRELTAFMVAKSDYAKNYGELVVYETPGGNVDGPSLVNSNAQNDTGISRIITLLNQEGSSVEFGNMLLVPVGESILYIRPVYVVASVAVPELTHVIAALGDSVVMCSSIDDSLEALFDPAKLQNASETSTDACVGQVSDTVISDTAGDSSSGGSSGLLPDLPGPLPSDPEPEVPDTTVPSEPTPTNDAVPELLKQAADLFEQADEALRSGDLGEYQDLIKRASDLISQALEQADQ